MARNLILQIGGEHAEAVSDILENVGIFDLSDLTVIDNEDIVMTFQNIDCRSVSFLARDKAKEMSKGWAKLTAMQSIIPAG